MEDPNQQSQQNARQQQQQQQKQHQQQQAQQQQNQQNQQQQMQQDGRQSSRKRITKTPPDASNPGSDKWPSGNVSGSNTDDQPPIPERTSSYPGHDGPLGAAEVGKKSSRRKGRSGSTLNANEDSGAALTAAEILRMGGVELPEDDSTNQGGGAGVGVDGEDSESTEFGEGGEAFGEPPAAPEPAPTSFAARKGKGKDKDKESKRKGDKGHDGGKKNKDKGVGGQEGMPSASEDGGGNGGNNRGNGGGSGKLEGKKNDSGSGGGGGDEIVAEYAFVSPRFIEEDMESDDDGHEGHDLSDFHDFDHGHGHNHNQGGDDSNVINLNNFPTNSRGPNDGRSQNNNSSASSAFASITHTLAGMMPLPRAPREDYMRTMTNDRRSLQETVQSLIVTLQHEQMRRMAAEDNVAVLQENLGVYKDLAAQFRDEANKLREETERSKKGHMQVLRDLNRFKAGQGFSQMADDFLTQKARELRQDIRDFAIQYFDGEFEDPAKNEHPPPRAETKLGEFMAGISPLDPFQSFLASPTRCSSAVESFLWVILAKTVFGGWYWAGGGRLPLHDVFAWMRPVDFSFAVYNNESSPESKDASGGAAADPEAERRFYTWRATTAKLVSERPGIMVRDNLRNKLVEEIRMTIEPYLRAADDGSHAEELHNIINKAIEFDRDTSQQASRLEWIFCRHPGQKDPGEPQRFNPNVMDIQMWEETPTEQSEVLLVVAPGLRKRGRSNGEDYSVETMLLKMDVTCDPVTDMVVG